MAHLSAATPAHDNTGDWRATYLVTSPNHATIQLNCPHTHPTRQAAYVCPWPREMEDRLVGYANAAAYLGAHDLLAEAGTMIDLIAQELGVDTRTAYAYAVDAADDDTPRPQATTRWAGVANVTMFSVAVAGYAALLYHWFN